MKILFILINFILAPQIYAMGYYEIALNGSISKFYNNEVSYTKTNVVGGSLAYRFISTSAIELSYSNTFQVVTAPYSTTKGTIDVVSINLIVYILGNQYNLQPYIKGGPGYMNRRYQYLTDGFSTIESKDESMTATFGGGVKYMFIENLGLQGEATCYISDFKAQTRFINYTITAGITVRF